ncbi:MAG: hypothetical protein WCJ62_13415, partial [Flavobacterium sp.]
VYTDATSPIHFKTGSGSGTTGGGGTVYVPEDCDVTSPSTYLGCIKNVFHDLFTPSDESINQFSNLYLAYKNKPPFGYVVAIQAELANLNDTGASVFTLHSLPVLNTMIFTPMRTAIIWVLWVGFTFVMYHRLKNLQI